MGKMIMPGGIERPVIDITPAPGPTDEEKVLHANILAKVNAMRIERADAVTAAETNLGAINRALTQQHIRADELFAEYNRLVATAALQNLETIANVRLQRDAGRATISDLELLRNVAEDCVREARQRATEGALRRAAEELLIQARMSAAR